MPRGAESGIDAARGAPRRLSAEAATEDLSPGQTIFIPGSAGEPTDILAALKARPERTRGLTLVTSAIPGINLVEPAAYDPSIRIEGVFMQPNLRDAQRAGLYRHLPLTFWGFTTHLRDRTSFDACFVQVAPPDEAGRCSLGAAVEFNPIALGRSRRRVAVVNPAMPRIPGAATVPLSVFDAVVETEAPLPVYDVGPPSASARLIAERVAGFIEDGSALQVGLGKVPEHLFGMLHDRRGLKLQSGMLSDSALPLQEAGALDPDFEHRSCVWVGSSELYRRLDGREGFTVASCDVTHDIRRLAEADRFVAINSALAVDLFGQANLEHAEGRAVSGVGGAADFAAATRLSRFGLSIVALPAAFGREPRSRIVARLGDGLASLPRHAVDCVVTEHGTADLRGLCVHGRAEAIIEVAAPVFRPDLRAAWSEIRERL